MSHFTIQQLSTVSGLDRRTIRSLEKHGLLGFCPGRKKKYNQDEVELFRHAADMLSQGISMKELIKRNSEVKRLPFPVEQVTDVSNNHEPIRIVANYIPESFEEPPNRVSVDEERVDEIQITNGISVRVQPRILALKLLGVALGSSFSWVLYQITCFVMDSFE